MISFLTLLDDIATTFDDIAIMTKIAMKKTSALMTDDLAVNAGVINGTAASREIPVVKAIFYGSLINKLYCIIGVFIINAIYSPAIKFILFLGGIYLSYEGVHKIFEKISNKKKHVHSRDLNIPEDERIKGAVKTDLILSAEIIVLAKETLSGTLLTQILTLLLIGILASVIIYGLIAILIKMDDWGLILIKKGFNSIGQSLISFMPILMKGLGVIGTIAMLLVGGGIINHTFHFNFINIKLLQDLLSALFFGSLVVFTFTKLNKKKINQFNTF